MQHALPFRKKLLVAAIGLSTASISLANEKVLDSYIVIGEPQTSLDADVVGSVDYLSQEEIAYEHVNDTLEIFNKVPGVSLSRYNQGVINNDISIRGFAGDGVTPHAKLLIDGIPSNYHNGYNELDQLFPLNIAGIEVFKGTSDPRYGLFNTAGNYNVFTRQDEAQQIEVTYGSFNTKEVQAYAGYVNDRLTHNYSFGYRTGEGYRDHTDLDKYAFSGSWQWDFENDTEFRIIARRASYEGDSPGYLTKQEAADDPEQSASYASEDGGDKETNHISAHWSQAFNDKLQWNLKLYYQEFKRERWVRFSESGTLRDRVDDQDQWGLISTLSWFINDDWELDWGLDYESQDIIEQRFNTIDNQRIRNSDSVRRNHNHEFNSYGTYLKLAHEPNEALRWNVSLRADRLSGDGLFTTGTNTPQEHRELYDYGTILQPKFNIIFAANDSVDVFANAGRSFQQPYGSTGYTSGDRKEQDVSITKGWEVGTQWSPTADLTLRVSYWQLEASNEYVDLDFQLLNVGETEREGIDFAFNGSVNEKWSYWGNFTLIDMEIVKPSADAAGTKGNELRSIPDFVASLGLNYQATPKLVTRLHLDAQGDYFVNENNQGGKFGDYVTLGASADYNTSWGKVKFQLNNITDEKSEYVYDFTDDGSFTIHSPHDGINGSISVMWNI
jgi:iron complex outermembrane receptor protein